MPLVIGVPPSVLELQQQGALERAFHDGLFPNLAFRSEATFEEWPANSGTEVFMSRPGLLTPVTRGLPPGQDPIPQNVPYEQWSASLERYASAVDTHIPTSVVSNSNLFLRNIQQLGLNAGMSINRISRNFLFKPYLSGQTVLTDAAVSADTSIKVASLNGFTDVISLATNARPTIVSIATPLAIRIAGVTGVRQVIGFTANDPQDPWGPGILYLSAALGANIAARAPVLSTVKPNVIRTGGGDSVDALGPSDTFLLQDAINAVAELRAASVQPHDDGFYHAHISPRSNAQVYGDPAFQRLNQSLPENAVYKEGFIGTISGIMFFMNNEAPDMANSGSRTATSANAAYSADIGAETTNDSGVNVGRIIITGKGALLERGLDESQYVTEAGTTGRMGEFDVVNNGVSVSTERISLILRAPMNRLQDQVSAAWSTTTAFAVPSDITAPSGPQRFKRAIVIEHALLSGCQPGLTNSKGGYLFTGVSRLFRRKGKETNAQRCSEEGRDEGGERGPCGHQW